MPKPGSNFSRYVIPDDLDPESICCVSVPVPDDPQWRAMFLGALWRLSLQTHWERDDNQSAKIVAARWREIFHEVSNNMGTCTPSDAIIRRTINADFRLALNVEFTANGLDGIAPDRPDTFFDQDTGDAGDDVQRRSNALCNACIDFVNTIADDATNVARTAGLTIVPALIPIVWSINPIGGAVFVGALSLLSLIAQAAFNDEEIRHAVACCMYENLQGVAITEANFAASLTGCGFAPLSDNEIVREILESGVNDRADYLAFVSVLGSFMGAVGSSETDCACGIFEHTFDFEVSDQGWTTRAEDDRDFGVYTAGVGWESVYGLQVVLAERLYMQIQDFDERVLLSIEGVWIVNDGSVASRNAIVDAVLADVVQDSESWTDWPQPGEVRVLWEGIESADEIQVTMVDGWPGATEGRDYILKAVHVVGRGTDPF